MKTYETVIAGGGIVGLNAASPGFTAAFSFARFALDFDKVEAA
jgi:thioredoxin reductase